MRKRRKILRLYSAKYFIFGGLIVVFAVFGIYSLISVEDVQDVQSVSGEAIHELPVREDVNFELVAGGDVMLSRHVGEKIRQSGDNAMPFRKINEIFSGADIAFINLEAPFYDQGPIVIEGMLFKVEPEFIEGLILSGIDVVSLANNHTRNKGRAGILYTLDYLNQNGIEYSGAGKDFDEAHSATVFEIEGMKISLLSYTYSDGNAFTSQVEIDDPDVAFMDIDQMKRDVAQAKKESDVVIVSMHAGVEYKHYPNQQQQDFAHAAIDSGAELVLGHHPHVVQSVEQYDDGFIIYSMGNLVFDQMWSQETREGVITKCMFENNDVRSVEFIPTVIENYSQPRLANETEGGKILGDMGLTSSVMKIE